MKIINHQKFCAVILLIAACGLGTGCSTTNSNRAQPLKSSSSPGADLSRYQTATVVPFSIASGKKIDPSVGAKFSEDIARRLEKDFGPMFTQVRRGEPLGQLPELIVTGTINSYQPGSRIARGILIGLGAASFKAELQLKDGATTTFSFLRPSTNCGPGAERWA